MWSIFPDTSAHYCSLEGCDIERWHLYAGCCALCVFCVTLGDGVMTANLHRRAGSWPYTARKVSYPPPLSHHPTEGPARQRPRLCCLRDLFSHIGDTALLQCACVGGSTWNAIIHYSLTTEPLPAAPKYGSRNWHILLRHNRIFNFLQHTLSSEQFLQKCIFICYLPSSMVRAVMDSLSAPWNSLKYGRTLIS